MELSGKVRVDTVVTITVRVDENATTDGPEGRKLSLASVTPTKSLTNKHGDHSPQKYCVWKISKPPSRFELDTSGIELVSLSNAILKQYPSLILVCVLLLSGALVLLPQPPIPDILLRQPARGLDKPQDNFLASITARPVLTVA